MEFEWDYHKRLANLSKHSVDFEIAKTVFASFWFSEIDNRRDYGEVRQLAIGTVEGAVVVVAFTDRAHENGMVRRIISARRASQSERKKFYEAKQGHDRLGAPSEHD